MTSGMPGKLAVNMAGSVASFLLTTLEPRRP